MAERIRACDLLRRAGEVYDDPSCPLKAGARGAWLRVFASGGRWMQQALAHLRNGPVPPPVRGLNTLGTVKYGLACLAAFLVAALVQPVGWPLLALCVPAFYFVEAQMLFLFPVALDGTNHPFREARRWTVRAGGTYAVVRIVLPLAAMMLLGGFAGRGFVRSWCLGCLSVCVWYENLRQAHARAGDAAPEPTGEEEGQTPSRERGNSSGRESRTLLARFVRQIAWLGHTLSPLKFGAFGPLAVRHELLCLGLSQRARLLYASDLHLGHWWTQEVPAQLVDVCRRTRPDIILLGGDLVDHVAALASLRDCIRALAAVAPVVVVPGNHDDRVGVPAVRDAVVREGGQWLPDRPLESPLRIDARVSRVVGSVPRLLCSHYPSDFPEAARAGYRLVLAGHLHGGQCVLATVGGRLYPAAWFHRWHGLRFTHGDCTLLVSRGVADTFPLRFNCPREVILCEIS